jgi:hypothetical protein
MMRGVEIARLVLDYLKALVWPLATLIIVYGFRGQIRDLIRRVRTVHAPGIDAAFSEQVADVSAEVAAAMRWSLPAETAWPPPERTEPPIGYGYGYPSPPLPPDARTSGYGSAPPPGAEADAGAREDPPPAAEYDGPNPWDRDYGSPAPAGSYGTPRPAVPAPRYVPALEPAPSSAEVLAGARPDMAVVAAWSELETRLRALGEERLGTAQHPDVMDVRELARRLDFPNVIGSSLAKLRGVRDRAAHGADGLTPGAAASYVTTCRELGRWIASQTPTP